MPSRLLLLALTCLVNTGCAKRSAALVDGDPFNTPGATVRDSRVPMPDSSESVAVEGIPDDAQLTHTTYEYDRGQVAVDTDLAEASHQASATSEWWNSPAAMAAAKDDVKLPSNSGANGRVGHVSVSYGMGQIK
ncbi:MAG TPA: hypothetical protein VM452_06770 [Caulifigura sp.]|jgi:hypothetical protein|nr:hypothetical protein [Caulifigura sp.]